VCQKPVRFPVEGRTPLFWWRPDFDGRTETATDPQEAEPGVLPGEVDSHIEPKGGLRAERWFSTESLILAQDERWRRA